jgi:hypothetical protein
MELFTLDFLLTYAGCVLATGLIVQLLKDVIPMQTRILSYIVALIVFNVASLALGAWTWQGGALSLFNSVIVAFAASGGYDFIQRIKSAGANTNPGDSEDAQ